MNRLDHILIAAAVAAIVSGAAIEFSPSKQIAHTVNASKHAWPDLTDAQKTDLAARLAPLKGAKIEILSADAASVDLAQDIDDVCEDAGIDSVLDRPFTPVPYGIFVQAEPGDARAETLAGALRAVMAMDIKVVAGKTAASGRPLWIVIGKAPRA